MAANLQDGGSHACPHTLGAEDEKHCSERKGRHDLDTALHYDTVDMVATERPPELNEVLCKNVVN